MTSGNSVRQKARVNDQHTSPLVYRLYDLTPDEIRLVGGG
jgi:hypothetical protein